MKRVTLIAIFLVVLCTVFTSFGQYFIKQGAVSIVGIYSILSLPLVLGLVLYAIGSILLIIALRKGDLSLIYPFVSLSFVWVALIGVFLIGESISLVHIFGIGSIFLGVVLTGLGGRNG